ARYRLLRFARGPPSAETGPVGSPAREVQRPKYQAQRTPANRGRVVIPNDALTLGRPSGHACFMADSGWFGDSEWFDSEEFAEFQRHSEGRQRLWLEAQREVQASARGRPVAEVEEDFQRALQARGVTMPPEMVAVLSRRMADPFWDLKHPILSARERREGRRREQNHDDPPPNDDPILDRLFELLLDGGSHEDVTLVGSRWTPRGTAYHVGIYPWSDATADRVRRVCAPTPVIVIERRVPSP
ncbi:MAG: hypothetical protein ACRDV2_01195, partial [Actinomycetes bacterium]